MKKGYAERAAKRARRKLLKAEISNAETKLSEARITGNAKKAAELEVAIAHMREEHWNLRERRPGARGERRSKWGIVVW